VEGVVGVEKAGRHSEQGEEYAGSVVGHTVGREDGCGKVGKLAVQAQVRMQLDGPTDRLMVYKYEHEFGWPGEKIREGGTRRHHHRLFHRKRTAPGGLALYLAVRSQAVGAVE
jgi:hypothetical protein